MRYPWIAGAILIAAVLVSGSARSQEQPPPAGQGRGGRGANFPQQQRPPGDPAVIARGKALYGVHCTACHGPDLRGGDQGGPNLLRSEAILTDQKGENIGPIVRDGRRGAVGTMPAFPLPEADVLAIAEFLHSVMGQAGRQGRPPERETPIPLNVLVGDASAGQIYFTRACSRCHAAADMSAVVRRAGDPRDLQNLWVSGGASGRGGGGRGGAGEGGGQESRVRVTVTPPGGQPLTGRLVRLDDFIVTLVQDDGTRRTFRREGAQPKIEVADPLEPHRRLVLELTDRDMHNVTAYLATLK
jgi:cytochrome c oxidase cbb3-type subunit 3